ncbi:NAD-dependent epimerase/dehydratase [Richelia sinica FACHB-800]|uniref:NAD-dependent epimerase/dehydratase n=1 Tax=Richelia sinica FACHB-800 TaxID=1357546 RepID=A0A975T833_9NOST|nr:SDR family oxidoreductase [Richelia sinica]MBD2665946.1 SDR family oxidoreductase [Richelia sinica FACHB-800]QXE23943.1 NAD-dependent epimerase/dehydratase [Richelia sinica FACHB-800]
MTNTSYIFLAGASRGVGREIANCFTAQHFPVKALLRTEAAQAELADLGIRTVIGDAMNVDDVERAMLGDEPIQAVISTVGGFPADEVKPDYIGNKNLIDAAVKAGVKKFILVTSIGTGNSASALPAQTLAALKPVLIEKNKAEQHLIKSGLNYTIIRPGGLISEPATGNAILTEDTHVIGSIHRADVAQIVYRCFKSPSANKKVLSVVDRNMIYPGLPGFMEFKLK